MTVVASTNWYTFLSTWFGAGRSKFAPGTVGSLAALPFAYILHHTVGWIALPIAAFAFYIIGILATEQYLKHHASTADPKEVVIDEVAGQMLALTFLAPTLTGYIVGFLLFRLFDVLKPWPISWVDKHVNGATGIMLDDMLAGMAAAILPVLVLYGLVYIPPMPALETLLTMLVTTYVP